MKKLLSVLLCYIMIISLSAPTYAVENTSTSEIDISESLLDDISNAINSIAPQKELFGFDNSSINNIYVGKAITTYEYVNGTLKKMDLCLYPLLANGKLCAFAIKEYDNNINISTGLIKEISQLSCLPDSLIYDSQSIYYSVDNNIMFLTQASLSPIATRETLTETSIKQLNLSNSVNKEKNVLTPLGYINSGVTPRSSYAAIAISSKIQTGDLTCWAACVACIGQKLTGINRTDEDVVIYKFGYWIDTAIPDAAALNTLANMYGVYYNEHAYKPSETQILTALNNGAPVFSRWTPDGNWFSNGHDMVICAINTSTNYLTVMDPEDGVFHTATLNGTQSSYSSLYRGKTYQMVSYGVRR